MALDTSHRIGARIAVIKLRSLLVADAHMSLRQRSELIELASGLIDQDEAASRFRKQIEELIEDRFGRNPDTFEVAPATAEALDLLNAVQAGKLLK